MSDAPKQNDRVFESEMREFRFLADKARGHYYELVLALSRLEESGVGIPGPEDCKGANTATDGCYKWKPDLPSIVFTKRVKL